MIRFSTYITGNIPLLAVAVHNGHDVRKDVVKHFAVDDATRLREEDPFTADFSRISENRLIVNTSRFEVDMNRPRVDAIYRSPEQSWGIKVWKNNVSETLWEDSLAEYDFFYRVLNLLIEEFIRNFGFIVVYDIHTYNYRRQNQSTEDSPVLNPEINLGTGSLNRDVWAPVVDHFIQSMSNYNYFQRHLDVRENIRFKGGFLSQWIHQNYPNKSCVLAIEIKKIFMDEWTGNLDIEKLNEISNALKKTIPGVLRRAKRVEQVLGIKQKYTSRQSKMKKQVKRHWENGKKNND